MPARVKITDEMVEAAINSVLSDMAEEFEMPWPEFVDASFVWIARNALQAAADVAAKENE